MRILLRYLFVMLFATAVAACGDSPDGPSADNIRSALLLELPAGVDVGSVDLQVAENTGSEVEPIYRSRSKVELKLTEDFYQREGMVDGKPLVKKVGDKGDTISGILITTAEPTGDDSWKVRIQKFDSPSIKGTPESKFGTDGFVIEDSKEHKQLLDKQKADAAAEEKERAAAAESAKREFAGTWTSTQPTLYRDSVYARDDRQLGFALTLNPGSGDVGSGTAKVFNYKNPQEVVQGPISFVVDDSGDYVTVTFDDRLEHRGLRWYVYPRTKWVLKRDGTFTNGLNSTTWVARLSK